MSSQTVVNNTGQQLQVNTDLSRIFLWENRYHTDSYVNNSGYDPLALKAGTVMGRIATSGILVPCMSWASDGSQFPVGILANDMSIAAGATVQASICVYGDVAEDKVIMWGSGDTLETVVSSRRYRDRIAADTVGIRLVVGTEMTGYDNQ